MLNSTEQGISTRDSLYRYKVIFERTYRKKNPAEVKAQPFSVHVFTGSDLITGSSRIGPDRARNWLFSSFLKHFFYHYYVYRVYIYDHNNDVWIIKVGDDSYHLTGSGPKMVK